VLFAISVNLANWFKWILGPKAHNMAPSTPDHLPKLPIPPLEDTCNRYLRALVALQDEKEHETTKAAVRQFLLSDGPKLQEALKEYAQDKQRSVPILPTLCLPCLSNQS
jgi:hypothetical protein